MSVTLIGCCSASWMRSIAITDPRCTTASLDPRQPSLRRSAAHCCSRSCSYPYSDRACSPKQIHRNFWYRSIHRQARASPRPTARCVSSKPSSTNCRVYSPFSPISVVAIHRSTTTIFNVTSRPATARYSSRSIRTTREKLPNCSTAYARDSINTQVREFPSKSSSTGHRSRRRLRSVSWVRTCKCSINSRAKSNR